MAWLFSDAFSDTPQAPGEMVVVYLTNPPLNESRPFTYTRYGFEDNAAFEARVRADIVTNLNLLNAQYGRRQSQAQRFRPGGANKPGTEGAIDVLPTD